MPTRAVALQKIAGAVRRADDQLRLEDVVLVLGPPLLLGVDEEQGDDEVACPACGPGPGRRCRGTRGRGPSGVIGPSFSGTRRCRPGDTASRPAAGLPCGGRSGLPASPACTAPRGLDPDRLTRRHPTQKVRPKEDGRMRLGDRECRRRSCRRRPCRSPPSESSSGIRGVSSSSSSSDGWPGGRRPRIGSGPARRRGSGPAPCVRSAPRPRPRPGRAGRPAPLLPVRLGVSAGCEVIGCFDTATPLHCSPPMKYSFSACI